MEETALLSSAREDLPTLEDRDLFDDRTAQALSEMFSNLTNPTRLKLLHCLIREEECSVGALSGELDVKTQAVSNQLRGLRDRGILASRREGNYVYYRIVDPCVEWLLRLGLCLLESTE